MRTIKNRVLTLLLAGLMAGQAILPVSAAEITDVAEDTETTEAEVTDTVETETETETSASDTAGEQDAEDAVEETTDGIIEEITIEPVDEDTEENAAVTQEESETDVVILSDDEASSGGEIVEKTYSVDPFDEEYAAGYFCISDESVFAGSNTSRSDNIYVDHVNGACINGTYYDIREYTWMSSDNSDYGVRLDGSVYAGNSSSGWVRREIHFYEAGTLGGENPVEVSFRGVLHLTDFDKNEGYTINQGLIGVWLNNPTKVTRRNSNTWKGTVETWGAAQGDIEKETDYTADYRDAMWVEVEGTPENPLLLTYWNAGWHASHINYTGCKITYQLVGEGVQCIPPDADPVIETGCATYGYYNLISAKEYKYYVFDGWYMDEDLTEKAEGPMIISEDQIFYGAYTKVAGRIDTEVIGGTITDSIDYIDYGKDATIEYRPNDGYFLDTITVDGEIIDPEQYEDSYLFADIQDDHSIKVVYVKAEEPTKSVINTNGKDMDGQLTKAGETLVYTISVQNPASTTKTFKVTDNLPDGIEFVSADHNGTYANGTVTWSLDMVAGEKMTLTVKAKAAKVGTAYVNTAAVAVGGIEMTTNETKTWTVADPVKSVKDVDGNDVDGEFLVDGETVTYIIAVKNPADDARAFTITDKIPANMEFISADHDGKVANGVITWTIELNGGAEETVRFQAKAMKAGVHYVNSADVTVEDIKTTTNETSNWVMEDPVKVVEMDGKDAADAIVEYNDELTYTITAKNPADKSVKATITDELPDGVTFVTANHGGQESNGTVTWEITMESKETVEFSVVVRVQKISQSKTITNKASVFVNGSTYETNEVENTIRPYKEPETTETHKTINNETENNKVVNNTTINNTTENNAVKNDTEATPAETTTVTGYRNVNTGDMARTGLLVAISTAVAIGLGIYYYRKRR